jgi:uncharacterized protein (DUF342 family)
LIFVSQNKGWGAQMKCSENEKEIEYYTEIINFYEQTTEIQAKHEKKVENWEDLSFIKLMKDVKENKILEDKADVKDVVKNSIILILNLFDEKCQLDMDTPIENLNKREQAKIRRTLEAVIQ